MIFLSVFMAFTNKETVGFFYQAPVIGEGVIAWLRQGLGHLGDSGEIAIAGPESPAEDTPSLETSLHSVSVYSNPMRMHANIVLDAGLKSDSGSLMEKHYRGEGDVFEWTASRSEMMEALNEALANVIREMRRDIAGVCEKKE